MRGLLYVLVCPVDTVCALCGSAQSVQSAHAAPKFGVHTEF